MIDSWNAAVLNDAIRDGDIGGSGGGSILPDIDPGDYGSYLAVDEYGKWGLDKPKTLLDYKTTEQDTGLKWVDGKTIYFKTYMGIMESGRHAIDNFTDNIVKIEGCATLINGGNSFQFSLPGYPGDQNPLRAVPFVLDDVLVIDGSSGTNYKVVVYYTKNENTKGGKKK